MVLGFSTSATTVHAIVGLVAIATGLAVRSGRSKARRTHSLTGVFRATTVAALCLAAFVPVAPSFPGALAFRRSRPAALAA